MSVNTALEAQHAIAVGDTGSGKSAWTKRQVARRTRLLIWDPDDEWHAERGVERVLDRADLVDKLKRRQRGRFAFVSDQLDHFDWWCRAAFLWKHCTAVAEEIADVTHPGKAPPGWGKLCRRGRKHGIEIFATTQRPAESDKTIWTQARRYFIGQMPDADSVRYVARRLSIEESRIQALGPLDYLTVDKRDREIQAGRLVF